MLLALGVLVVLGHALLLDAMYGLRQPKSLLHDMAVPMYTRVLAPTDAPQPTPPAHEAEDSLSTRAVTSAAAAPLPRAKASAARRAKPRKAAASQAEQTEQAEASRQDPPRDEGEHHDGKAQHTTAAADLQHEPASDSNSPASAPAATGSTQADASDADQAHTAQASPDPSAPGARGSAQAAQASAPASQAASVGAGANAAVAQTWPPNTRLNYKLGGNYRGELHGTARVLWQTDGSRYQAQVDLNLGLLASMRLTSQGEMTARSLKPAVYEELVRKKRRNVRLGDDTIHLANGETAARPAHVQDTASQFIELSHRFASGQVPLAVGQTVQFALVRPNRVAQWTYDVVEDTQIHLPSLGPTRALLVRPRPVDGEKQNVSAQMWLAPSLQYLPVRIVLNMGSGDQQVDLMLERIDQGDGAAQVKP